jgi:hypothetical protein
MTLVRISDPTLLFSLRAHLAERADCIATAVSADTLDVTIIGSYNEDAMDLEAQLRVRAWEEAQRAQGVDVRVSYTSS